MASTSEGRREIALDTLRRTQDVISSTPGASDRSFFINDQLPSLDPTKCPRLQSTKVHVVGTDSYTAAREIIRGFPEAIGKTAVLNLASDEKRAGGWMESFTRTQEEALCYSSTVYATLKEDYYPWPNLGPGSIAGIFSPDIVVFKNDLDHNCVDLPLEERRLVSVISVAAPRNPALTKDGTSLANERDLDDFRGKIRLVYRMAGTWGKQAIVLAAMGCGVYGCPPRQVADEMKSILLEDEFKGWFRNIVFAVYKSLDRATSPNYDIFKEVFEDLQV